MMRYAYGYVYEISYDHMYTWCYTKYEYEYLYSRVYRTRYCKLMQYLTVMIPGATERYNYTR